MSSVAILNRGSQVGIREGGLAIKERGKGKVLGLDNV